MSDSFNPHTPIEPLSLGNVVSAGMRLYRSNLKSYFLLALTVSLWSLLPILFFVTGILLFLNFQSGNNSPLAWLIVVVIGLSLNFYALGKSLVNSAIISRLAFAELINQPETVNAARIQVAPRMWTFVLTTLLLFVIFFGIFILVGIVLIIPLLNILVFLPVMAAFLWLVARFFLADTLLAIEDNLGAVSAVSRSWDLTKGNAWRIVLILFVGFLVTLPIQVIVQLISRGIVQAFIQPAIQDAINGSTNAIFFIATFYVLTLILGLLINAVILPFWQSIKAVVYYDLRSRREGMGLKLRDREI